MSATKAEALAVALDHAEETGEYPPELVARVIALFGAMRIVQLVRATPGDSTSRGRTSDGRQLVSVVHHRAMPELPARFGSLWMPPTPAVPAEPERFEAVIHTALTGTHLCERETFPTREEAVSWLSTRLKLVGWTLLETRG